MENDLRKSLGLRPDAPDDVVESVLAFKNLCEDIFLRMGKCFCYLFETSIGFGVPHFTDGNVFSPTVYTGRKLDGVEKAFVLQSIELKMPGIKAAPLFKVVENQESYIREVSEEGAGNAHVHEVGYGDVDGLGVDLVPGDGSAA